MFKRAITEMVQCYNKLFGTENVFLADYPIAVYWGHVSLLEMDLICLRQLLNHKRHWDMYVDMAGSELPMVTYETFERALHDSFVANHSIVESKPMPETNKRRVTKSHYLRR